MNNLTEPIRDIKDIKKLEENLPPAYSLIFKIGIQTGLRVSDILALNIDIVGKKQIKIREQKTGKTKIFPVNEELQKEICDYYKNIRTKQYTIKKKDENAIFITKSHNRYERSAVYRMFNKIAKEQDIDINIGTHSMRKTFGYHHYKQYGDVVLLQTIMNHSSPSITLRYIGVTQDDINSSYKNFCLSTQTPQIITDKNNEIKEDKRESRTRRIIKEEFERMEERIKETIIGTIVNSCDYMLRLQNKKLDKLLKVIE